MDDLSELKKLLEENLVISKQIYKDTQKIRKYFFWSRLYKLLKWLMIIAALLAGFLYSKPYLEKIPGIYKNLYEKIISISEFVNNKNSQPSMDIINKIQNNLR